MAVEGEYPRSRRIGVRRNPPPTPKNPEIAPMAKPVGKAHKSSNNNNKTPF